jgi:hypothetical protein
VEIVTKNNTIKRIEEDICRINTHMEIINRELGELHSDNEWLKKLQWVQIAPLLGILAYLIFKGGV